MLYFFQLYLRCRKQTKEKCKFRITLKLLNIQNPAVPGFYAKNNFEIKSINSFHSCTGYETESEAQKLEDMTILGKKLKNSNPEQNLLAIEGPLKFDFDN